MVNAGAVMWHGVTDDTLARAYPLLGNADDAARHRAAALATYERSKAIVATVAKVAETDPWLGRHLHDRVHAGFDCRYESDPGHPIEWILRPIPLVRS